MEITAKGYRLSSGREFRANGLYGAGLVSLARQTDGAWLIGTGYDSILSGATGSDYDEDEQWTPEERRELAEFMIAQWTAFKESSGPSFELIDERDPTPEERARGILKQRFYRSR